MEGRWVKQGRLKWGQTSFFVLSREMVLMLLADLAHEMTETNPTTRGAQFIMYLNGNFPLSLSLSHPLLESHRYRVGSHPAYLASYPDLFQQNGI